MSDIVRAKNRACRQRSSQSANTFRIPTARNFHPKGQSHQSSLGTIGHNAELAIVAGESPKGEQCQAVSFHHFSSNESSGRGFTARGGGGGPEVAKIGASQRRARR